MTDRIQIDLKETWLPALGQALGSFTPLSPFGIEVEDAAEGDVQAELVEAGLVAPDGTFTEPYGEIFKLLSAPRYVRRLRAFNPPADLDYLAYFDGRNADAIALMSKGEGFLLQWPASPLDILGFLVEYVGLSAETTIDYTILLPYQDARVALAIVDLTRQYLLGNIALEADGTIPVVTPELVVPRLEPEAVHFNRLETALRQLDMGDEALTLDQVRASIESLGAKELIVQHEEAGWVVGEALAPIVDSFLMVTGHYRLDTLSVGDDGAVEGSWAMTVQGGPRSLLYMEQENESVRLAGVSAETFCQMVGPLFGATEDGQPAVPAPMPGRDLAQPPTPEAVTAQPPTPETAPAEPPTPEAAPADNAPRFCSSCGNPRKPGANFCRKCGAPLD